MTERNVKWVICEADDNIKNDVELQANSALDQNETEREISQSIKKFFDENYSPNWH